MKIKKQKELFLSCNVAGFAHYEGCIVFSELQIGTKLHLVREDENAYDHDAVAIFYGDTHIGYVPSAKNEQLATMLDLGHENLFEFYSILFLILLNFRCKGNTFFADMQIKIAF